MNDHINLLQETLRYLTLCHKTPEDVWVVGSLDGNYAITWEQFTKIANIEYDNGYGGQEIAADLIVLGEDWWLERHEYDGSEGWTFKSLPKIKGSAKTFTKVASTHGHTWYDLKRLQNEDEE